MLFFQSSVASKNAEALSSNIYELENMESLTCFLSKLSFFGKRPGPSVTADKKLVSFLEV